MWPFGFSKSKRDEKSNKCSMGETGNETLQVSNKKPSQTELKDTICFLSKLSYIFQSSKMLVGGRNETMKTRIFSYASILCFLYEKEYHYGKIADIIDANILAHYPLVKMAMSNQSYKIKTLYELSDNWSDVLQVIFNLKLLDNDDASIKLKEMDSEIKKATRVFEKLSGKECRKPSNSMNVSPKIVSYNPFNITEDPNRSVGHIIPDLTDIFAHEITPILIHAIYAEKDPKTLIGEYTLNMIKSYYDNAGFVPMVIIDQITGQINQVVEKVQHVSYDPHNSLKEYVLNKIYK